MLYQHDGMPITTWDRLVHPATHPTSVFTWDTSAHVT